jgi:hypothetical protein
MSLHNTGDETELGGDKGITKSELNSSSIIKVERIKFQCFIL